MTELEKYFQSYFDVTEADMSEIISLFQPAVLRKGEYFSKAGKPCDKMSFIQSGFLRVYVSVEDKEVTQWISSGGSLITDLSSFTFRTPSRWDIQALTDVELHTIHREDYDGIVKRVAGWPEIERRFIIQCFVIMENRIFGHLSMPAEQRYSAFFNENKELFNQVPLQYIASMLGMTPETFSRIRKKHQSLIS